jgi:para-nitrobenzyl esterase
VTRIGRIALAALVAVSVLAGCSTVPEGPGSSDAPLTVTTTGGELKGRTTRATRQFLGIRYALPPTGDRRWTLPEPVPPASGVTDATKAGSQCPQTTGEDKKPGTDEDCLFLNVTAPRRTVAGERLPVMVWWHGGGFTNGSGSQYGADRLAAQGDVIVVTVNYRLGLLGYLGLPGLPGSGSFGFADQIASLEWVKANAAAFGGDPGNVTVFGESAGAMSTCALLTSPKAAGLIEKAAISSGSCRLNWPVGFLYRDSPAQTPYMSLASQEAAGTATAARFGCTGPDVVGCLREAPPEAFLDPGDPAPGHMVFGTDLLPEDPAVALANGRLAQVPVLSGGNLDETRSFVGAELLDDPTSVTAESYPSLLQAAFGAKAADVAARYPLSAYDSPALAWSAVTTDRGWACPTLAGEQNLAAHTDVYAYEFADPDAPDVNGIDVKGLPQGAAHGNEMPSLFDLHGKNLLKGDGQRGLSDTMIGYWSSFARSGVPSAPGAPAWNRTTPGSAEVLSLAPGAVRTVDAADVHQCGFWATIG